MKINDTKSKTVISKNVNAVIILMIISALLVRPVKAQNISLQESNHELFALSNLAGLVRAETKDNPTNWIELGKSWRDIDGNVIEAHGGGILQVGDTYFWYGENHRLGFGNQTGISCYSSKDLYHWENEGIVLPKVSMPDMFRDSGVVERPKVLFNAGTGKYVMWMHLDAGNYTYACAGVAVADNPNGKFRFLRAFRPITFDYGERMNNPRLKRFAEKEKGNTYRDMTLFQDDDGKAYTIYSAEDNASIYISLLNQDYTDVAKPSIIGKTWTIAIPNRFREAPAVCKSNGKYYLFTSATTGWASNAASYAIADSILGHWEIIGNPCSGAGSEFTFQSQSAFILPAPGKNDGSFIFMADWWNSSALNKSTYIWLPFKIGRYGEVVIENYDKWSLGIFDANPSSLAAPVVRLADSKDKHIIKWNPVASAAGYRIFKNGKLNGFSCSTEYEVSGLVPGTNNLFSVVACNINGVTSHASNLVGIRNGEAHNILLSDVAEENYTQGWGVLTIDHTDNGGPIVIAGRIFKRGIGTHANSEILYNLGGLYKQFTSWIGRNTEMPDGKVQFRVYGDGRLLYLGSMMTGRTPAQYIEIPVSGVFELKLVVTDGGDGDAYDDASWAEACASY
jgi:hypothetical protein